MEQIDLKRPVIIKVIMTDDFRRQLIGEAQETMKRIEDNLREMESALLLQLEQEKEKTHLEQRSLQLRAEKERLGRMHQELDWKVRELENVQNGVELPFRVFEGSVPLKVGDNFLEKMSHAEVVIKNWEVLEIRGI